jgi:ATP-dependent DNA helicase RecG
MRALLPFVLTDSQEQALKILRDDAAEPARMHRLLQGDVGAGKTITALMATLPALNSGRQVAWMAPTEVLAKQTKSVVEKYLDNLGFRVEYLGAGDMREKREIQSGLASGELRFVVGTHALFMPSVQFSDLGMVIIDEQHKFGAAQRLKLQEKGPSSDFLLMSATPIPQTLAKTLYGDLDVVEIASRPDRAPISTHIVPEGKRGDMEKFILEQIRGGARAFYVVPRIDQIDDTGDDGDEAEENSASKSGGMSSRQFKQATSGKSGKAVSSNSNAKESIANKSESKSYHRFKQATASKSGNYIYNKNSSDNTSDIAPSIKNDSSIKTVDSAADMLMAGPLSAVPIHRLHGRMLYSEREMTINAFRNGEPGILVATTIVEVGIDVSDATVMVIENPEYFGLAQLHQIRGRVGRSDKQSYCFLLPGNNQNDDTTERLKFLCGCNDGFKIAEWDLRNRGPGDAAGSRQSGWDDLKAADILDDADMFREIMQETENLFK